MTVEFEEGDRAHVDTDNEEWGRVASNAIVMEKRGDSYLMSVQSIHANIIVPKKDISKIVATT